MISKEEILKRADELRVHIANVQRDYVFGWVLAGIFMASDLGKYLVLKGGNCLRKAYFDTTRFSPDLDFASTVELKADFIAAELKKVCNYAQEHSQVEFVADRTYVGDKKSVDADRKVYEGKIYFKDFFGECSSITISVKLDISQFGKIFLPIQTRNLIHPYSDQSICYAELKCMKLEEMLASKLKCLLQRSHSADLYDFVAATFLKPSVEINRGEIVSTFLKMTIFSSGPGIVKELLSDLPFQTIRTLWDKYLIYPQNAYIEFDSAVECLKSNINDMFGSLPIGRVWSFFPSVMRNKIMEAGHSFTLLNLSYDGLTRLVEPYSLTYKIRKDGVAREYFYAWDRTGGHSGPGIKIFLHEKIRSLENTETKFEPRFEVEISKAGEFGDERYFHNHKRRSFVTYTPGFDYIVECPICGKQFHRKRYDKKLNSHKDRYGNRCIGKVGFIV